LKSTIIKISILIIILSQILIFSSLADTTTFTTTFSNFTNFKTIWIKKYYYQNASKVIPVQACTDSQGNMYLVMDVIPNTMQAKAYVELLSLNKEGQLRWDLNLKGPLESTQALYIYCKGNSSLLLYLVSQNSESNEQLLLLYKISTNGTLLDRRFTEVSYLHIRTAYLDSKNMTLYISGDRYGGVERGLDMAAEALNAYTLFPKNFKISINLSSDEIAYSLFKEGKHLCLAGLGGIACINVTNKSISWYKHYKNLTFNSILISNNTVIAIGSLINEERGVLVTYNLTNGEVLQAYPLPWIPSDLIGMETVNGSSLLAWGFAKINESIDGLLIFFNINNSLLKPIHVIKTYFENLTLITLSHYVGGEDLLISGSSGTDSKLNNVYMILYGPPPKETSSQTASISSLKKILRTYEFLEYLFISITIASIILIVVLLKRYYKK